MTALIPLQFDTADVRMTMRDGEPWWVINDVCALVGLASPRVAASRLFPWQKDYVWIPDAIGRLRKTLVVNEAGIYGLVIGSNRPEAERFSKWLFTEVLPSIRKHGAYPPPPPAPPLPIDTEGPWDGHQKTIGQRFREERDLWEAANGRKLAGVVPGVSKNVIRAIEDDLGGMMKGERFKFLLYAGIDVKYVMTGLRTLTAGERALRDAYRQADPTARATLFSAALALPAPAEPEWDND